VPWGEGRSAPEVLTPAVNVTAQLRSAITRF